MGTPEQITKCKALLRTLKARAAAAFKPMKRFPISEPIKLQTRTFTNVRKGGGLQLQVTEGVTDDWIYHIYRYLVALTPDH